MTQTLHERSRLGEEAEPLSEVRRDPGRARIRWWWVLGAIVVVAYYALALIGVRNHDAGTVELGDGVAGSPAEIAATLHLEAVELDTSAGALDLTLRPAVDASLQTDGGTGLSEPLRVEVSSPGQPLQIFEFPAGQIIDPVGVSVGASRGAAAYPFDRPGAEFGLRVVSGGRWVPAAVEIDDQTDNWRLRGSAHTVEDRLVVDLHARRETLAVSFALFYIVGIVVVGLITVLVVGASVLRREVDFGEVIWLGAMLVAIPSVRDQMPGVPPIGTAADLFVFFPSIAIVGVALVAGVVVMSRSRVGDPSGAG